MNKDSIILSPLEKEENTVLKRIKRFFGRIKTSEYLYLIAAFLLPFTIMLGIYACMGVHPFGNNTVLMLDLQAQYIYYYEEIRSLLTEGGSFLYSWKRTLGGEFMGIIAYYGASLFNLLFVVFPKSMIADAMMFINLMKIGSMGLTFGIYIHKTRHPGEMKTLAVSVMYALCAYSVVQSMNPMWLDALVFLPLLMLGLERLIKEKKMILYTVMLTFIFIANYYIGYMTGIFTFIYFLYYYFSNRSELIEMYPPKAKGNIFSRFFSMHGTRTFARFAFGTLVALMIASFMLIAALYSLSFGKNNFQQTNWTFALRFDFLEIIYKMFIGSYDTVKPNGLPMIYSGMLALICLPVFYMAPGVKPAKKIGATLVLLALVLSFMINPVDLVWHGFNLPNWLNYRYSFFFSFMAVSMTADALCDIKKIKTTSILGVGGVLLVITAIIQRMKFPINSETTGAEYAKASTKTLTFALVAVLLIVAYMIIIYLVSHEKTENVGAFVLAAVVCVEMFAGGLMNLSDATMTDSGSVQYGSFVDSKGREDYTGYNSSINRIKDVVNEVLENDKSFYRMESKVYRRAGGENECMAFGFNGISHSTSTLNASVIKLMNNLGYTSISHYTQYRGGTPVSDALLGIKYVITKDELLDPNFYTLYAKQQEHYDFVASSSTIYAMQNMKALPIAYGVSKNAITLLEDKAQPLFPTGLDTQNEMIEAFLSETAYNGTIFKKIACYPHATDVTTGAFSQPCYYFDENGERQTHYVPYTSYVAKGDDPKITFSFHAKSDSAIYARFATDNFGKGCDVFVNGVLLCENYGTGGGNGILNIGTFHTGDSVEVVLELNDAFYISQESGSNVHFYYIDYEAANEAFSYLSNAAMNVEEHTNTKIKGNITLPKGQELIFTTIPYDEGWKCYIDGKKVDAVKVMGSLVGVPATEGYHEVEFRYMPTCYVVGFIVSALGALILIAMIVIPIVKKKRAPKLATANPSDSDDVANNASGDVSGEEIVDTEMFRAFGMDCGNNGAENTASTENMEDLIPPDGGDINQGSKGDIAEAFKESAVDENDVADTEDSENGKDGASEK